MSGKRESKTSRTRRKSSGGLAGWWRQHRAWVAGLNRGQKIRYRLFQFLVVLAILIIAVCLAARAWITLPTVPDTPSGTVTGEDGEVLFDGAQLPSVAQSGRKDGVYTFLLVGRDTAGGGNTDTIILFTFDTVNQTIHGMSLPRDTMVNSRHTGAGHRLNAVYNYNKGSDPDAQVERGMAALKTEVGKLTGIVPDYYVMVQWEAVGQLVDAIGGVWFEVPFDMDYDDPTPGQDLHIHQEAGYRLLDGEDAMEVIRWRQNNTGPSGGDVARISIQQDFLKAAISQCLKPEILLKAPSLVQIFMNNVNTDLSIGNILAFAQLAAGMDVENNVAFVTMPWVDARYPGVSMLLPDVDELLEILNDGFNPYLDDIQASDLSVLYRNNDGSYGVTSGTLLDSTLSRPRGSGSSSSSGGSGGSGGSSGGQTVDEPATEEPVENPDSSQPTDPSGSGEVTDPGGGTGENPDGSQIGGSSGGTGENPDGSLPTDPSGSGGATDPSGSQGGGQTDPGSSSGGSQPTDPSGSQSGGGSSSSTGGGETVPPSQDIQGGAVAQAPETESGLTTADLPSWLNPTGAEPAA